MLWKMRARYHNGTGTDTRRCGLHLLTYAALYVLTLAASLATAETSQPNILLVLTDDQDWVLDGMVPMRRVQQWVGAAGATFTNAFTSSSLCCPSRASLLSGMYAHNHRTTNNSYSGGCNGAHWRTKVEPTAWPVVLQDGGYDTFYAGKYLNGYHGEHLPPGWSEFYGLHGNSRYYNYTLRENALNVSYADVYLTDLLRDKALAFLEARTGAERPFFAMIAPPAPHAPFTPAERHRSVFADVKALRTPNFNLLSAPLEKHWLVQATRPLPDEVLQQIDKHFRNRWEALLAVDELVGALVKRLQEHGLLDNTYIIYTSDNGYHLGQFAQPWDKRQPYETDIRVPLLMRGPNIPAGIKVSAPTLLLDLPPTLLEWAGLSALTDLDGLPLQKFINENDRSDSKHHRSLLVQHWGEGNDDTYNAQCPWAPSDRLTQCTLLADCHCQDSWNNTYACVRHFRDDLNRLYCEFSDNENFVEAYDLSEDPYQITNLGYELLPIERAFYSLALANLTRCAGATCNDINI